MKGEHPAAPAFVDVRRSSSKERPADA